MYIVHIMNLKINIWTLNFLFKYENLYFKSENFAFKQSFDLNLKFQFQIIILDSQNQYFKSENY
jgi:hypothetical protein